MITNAMAVGLAGACLLVFAASANAITLARDGRPVATIVVREAALEVEPRLGGPFEPDHKVRWAAGDLQRVIMKMSGARLPIVGDGATVAGPVILVGASRRTEAWADRIPAGLTPRRREEGFLILCRGDTLLIAGNDEGPYNGTIYGVAEFLNRLGVRWFMPGEFGEVVPSRATVSFGDAEILERPDFALRLYGAHAHAYPDPDYRADLNAWRLHNKNHITSDELLAIAGDGHISLFLPGKDNFSHGVYPPEEFVEAHPEYFARTMDGRVNRGMVNLSHPDTPRLVAERIMAWIRAQEERTGRVPHSVGVALYDGPTVDYTPETMAGNLGFTELIGREGDPKHASVSEEWFRFMNKVVAEVVKEYPDFVIATNGYHNRDMPPEGVSLHPNLAVMFAPIWSDQIHAYDDPKSWQTVMQGNMLRRWCELSDRVYVYNYIYTMLVSALTPVPVTRKLARDYPLMKQWGVYGFTDEGNNSFMEHGMQTYYVRMKLQWDADVDVEAVLDDFFSTWYGPAAAPARAYWDALEECIESAVMLGHEDRILPYVYSPELVATLEARTREAEALAEQEPYRTRVRVDRLILEHLKGYMALNEAEFVGNYREAIKHADYMFEQRAELHRISPFFHLPEGDGPNQNLYAGAWYWNLTHRRDFYEKMLARLEGPEGRLIAQSPRHVRFRMDPANTGRLCRWHAPQFDRSDWDLIDTTRPFYIQGDNLMSENGVPYRGAMWYVFELEVPEERAGGPVQLYAPIVCSEAWVWVNGEFVGHRPYQQAYMRPAELDFDVTDAVVAGRNVIAVLVRADCLTEAAEGFQGPLFLYEPTAKTGH